MNVVDWWWGEEENAGALKRIDGRSEKKITSIKKHCEVKEKKTTIFDVQGLDFNLGVPCRQQRDKFTG